jgi:hypothetical protein
MFLYLRLSLACFLFTLLPISMVGQAPTSTDTNVTKISPFTNHGSTPTLAVQDGATGHQTELAWVPEGEAQPSCSTTTEGPARSDFCTPRTGYYCCRCKEEDKGTTITCPNAKCDGYQLQAKAKCITACMNCMGPLAFGPLRDNVYGGGDVCPETPAAPPH